MNGKNQTKKKKNKQNESSTINQQKSNLRQAPFYMDDGDLVAFVLIDSSNENANLKITFNDFMSPVDLDLVKKENLTKAELARLKKEKNNNLSNKKKETNYRRPEVGITIRIDDE